MRSRAADDQPFRGARHSRSARRRPRTRPAGWSGTAPRRRPREWPGATGATATRRMRASRRSRAGLHAADLADGRGAHEEGLEVRILPDQLPIRRLGERDELGHHRPPAVRLGRRRLVMAGAGCQEQRVRQLLQVALRDLRAGIALHPITSPCSVSPPVDRLGRLRQHGPVRRTAATTDRAATPMEQRQLGAMLPRDRGEPLPARDAGSTRPTGSPTPCSSPSSRASPPDGSPAPRDGTDRSARASARPGTDRPPPAPRASRAGTTSSHPSGGASGTAVRASTRSPTTSLGLRVKLT